MYPAVKSFAKENPTMILTLCYVLITAIGTGYSFFFYREFDINIIKFADLSDFLLAAILEPRSLGLFGFSIVMMVFAYWLDHQSRKRFQFYKNFAENRLKSKYTDPIIMMVVVFLSTVVLMRDLAVKNADEIKATGKDSYQVMFSDNEAGDSVKTIELLGSTSRFAYFYDPTNKKSIVISPENVNYMNKSVSEKRPAKAATIILKEPKKNLKAKEFK